MIKTILQQSKQKHRPSGAIFECHARLNRNFEVLQRSIAALRIYVLSYEALQHFSEALSILLNALWVRKWSGSNLSTPYTYRKVFVYDHAKQSRKQPTCSSSTAGGDLRIISS